MNKQVIKGDTIQVMGGFLEDGTKYDGFGAEVESSSWFNMADDWWEVEFTSSQYPFHGMALFNEEYQMWDVIEEIS